MDELLFETLGNMPLSAQLYTKAGVDKVVNDAIVGGVTSLLKFVGISSTDPITVGPTVDGITSYAEGNVVLWKPEGSSEYSEYVYATVDGALKWERLGDASRIGQLEAEVAKKADISALNAVDIRLSTAEGEIDTLQGEIVKKADISALNDGLALKADLTALNGVDGRLTTAEGEIDALQGAVATKAESSVVEGIDGRLSVVEGAVATKAESSVVEGIDGRVTTAEGEIDALQAEIATKANASDVVSKDLLMVFDKAGTGGNANIGDRYIAAQTEDGELRSTFGPDGYSMIANGQSVNYTARGIEIVDSSSGMPKSYFLTLPVNGTDEDQIYADIATSFDIEALNTDLGGRLTDVENALNLKADESIVTEMDGRLSQVINEVATKADSSTVDALDTRVVEVEGAVATKAEASVVEGIDGRVTTAEGEIDALQAEIATKAESSVVEGINGRLTTAESTLATKADASALNTFQGEFTDTVDTIWNAAAEAKESIANVTNVNELIAVLNTYFGKFSA